MIEAKDNRKADVREALVQTGRELVRQKGADFLTARKLSDASGYSVGTIYNQFANMDNFVIAQNILTLEELYEAMVKIIPSQDAYKNMSRYVDVYAGWVFSNPNLWFLLYNFHLQHGGIKLPRDYLRKFMKLIQMWQKDFETIVPNFGACEKKVFREVLSLAMFSLSSFLGTQKTSKVNRKNICKLLLNSYLAGISVLSRGGKC